MKKRIAIIAAIAIMIPSCLSWFNFLSEHFFYTESSYPFKFIHLTYSTIEITSYDSTLESESFTIPSEIQIGKDVKTIVSIGNQAFKNCHKLKEINIPSTVNTIKNFAFEGCEDIKISIDNSEQNINIESFAFEDNALVVFKYHQNEAVDNFSTLLTFKTTSISTAEVSKSRSLTNQELIVIPEKVCIENTVYTVTGIGEDAFRGHNAKVIMLPRTITYIGKYAFSNCKHLKDIKLPPSVKTIGESAFSGCEILESTKIPTGVKRIECRTFVFCKSLMNVQIPSTVVHIGESAFYNTKLSNLFIPKNVVNIENAFEYNYNAKDETKTITIDNSDFEVNCSEDEFTDYNVKYKNKPVYYSSKSPVKLHIESIIPPFTYIKDFENTVSVTYHNEAEHILIPSKVKLSPEDTIDYKVTRIERRGFSGDLSLKTVIISDGINSIGEEAFMFCSNIKKVSLPSSLVILKESVFHGCENLTDIEIPSSVTCIGKSTFEGCSNLKKLTIPSSVKYIGEDAFKNCNKLDIIIENLEEDVVVEESSFAGCKSVTYKK